MVSNDTNIYLGKGSGWPTKGGHSEHSEETAHTFPIRNADNEEIGNITRQGNKWTFKIFGRKNIPESLYNTKEEALAGARNSL